MKNYYLKHKNSGEEIHNLPNYGKYWNSFYGYLTITFNDGLKVLFFYFNSEEIDFEDLSDEYEILIEK